VPRGRPAAYPVRAVNDATYGTSDEISLRELYLILKRGAVGIVLTALLAGAAAFIYLTSRPAVYQASATVQVSSPQPAGAGTEAAGLVPQVSLGSQTYTALANGSAVLAAAFGPAAPDAAELRRLAGTLQLKSIDAANQPRGHLTVEHTARAATADLAADNANAWAAASAAAARATLGATVERSLAAATTELEARRAELDAAQARWTDFARDDARVSLRSQIEQLALQQAATRSRLAELNAKIAASSAQQGLLAAGIGAREGRTTVVLADQLRALTDAGVLPAAESEALLAGLGQLPPGLTVGGQDLLTLVDRARLEGVTSSLTAQVAERAALEDAAEEAEATAAALRDRLAELESRAAEPQAALALARQAYDRVAAAIPLLTLQQRMIADAAQVVVVAAPPLEPINGGRLTITAATVLVAALLATLVVFLRAAVAAPTAAPRPGRPTSTIDEGSGKVTRHDEELLTTAGRGR